MSTTAKFYGWKLVGILWFLYMVNMGFALYGGLIANTYMLKDVVMDRTTFGLGVTICLFALGLPSMLIAMSIEKWGARWTFAIGSMLIFVGSIIMSMATQPWHYFVGFGGFVGAGVGFATVMPCSTLVTRWFQRFRGKAMALTMTAAGFGGFIGSPAINKILALNGGNWHQTWLIIGGIALAGLVVSLLFVKERPEDLGQVPDGKKEEPSARQDVAANKLQTSYLWTPAEAYRTKAFWLIVIAGHATFYPFYFTGAHWVLHLKGFGLSAADAALGMGIFTLVSVFGKMGGGVLLDKLAGRYVFIIGICITALGSFLGINANSLMLAYIASGLLGLGFGWTFVTSSTIIANYYGPFAFPKLFGLQYFIISVTCPLAGVIGGKIFDIFNSYTLAFYINIAVCALSILAILCALPPTSKNEMKEKIEASANI